MIHRRFSLFRGRKLQAYQVSQWRQVRLSTMNTVDCIAVRQACTCLFTIAENSVEQLSPREAGGLVATICQSVEVMVFVLCEDPPAAEIQALCPKFREYFAERFPSAGICTTSVRELMAIVLTVLHAERDWNPGFATALQNLRGQPNGSEEEIGDMVDLLSRVTKRISRTVFHGLLPKLRIEYSFMEMAAFSRAYRRQDRGCDDDVPCMSNGSAELEVDDTESEFKGTGDRVELLSFCTFAKLVPRGAECSICVTQFDGTEEAVDELPVSTKCRHFFHKVCLDTWVNDSAMKASNTCPSCRTKLCEPRERVHASLEDAPISEDDDENDGSTAGPVAVVPSWLRVQRLNTRIITYLSLGSGPPALDDDSDTDDWSISSGESGGGVPSRRVLQIIRAERRD